MNLIDFHGPFLHHRASEKNREGREKKSEGKTPHEIGVKTLKPHMKFDLAF
jgi:hypothetical protein